MMNVWQLAQLDFMVWILIMNVWLVMELVPTAMVRIPMNVQLVQRDISFSMDMTPAKIPALMAIMPTKHQINAKPAVLLVLLAATFLPTVLHAIW